MLVKVQRKFFTNIDNFYPFPTNSLNASKRPSNDAQSTGVISSSSLLLVSERVISLRTSKSPSFAAL